MFELNVRAIDVDILHALHAHFDLGQTQHYFLSYIGFITSLSTVFYLSAVFYLSLKNKKIYKTLSNAPNDHAHL